MIIAKVQGAAEVYDMLGNIRARLPYTANLDTWKVSEMIGRALRESLQPAGIESWTGALYHSTIPHKEAENIYAIDLPEYAYWLDAMKPHFAQIGGGRLREWLDNHRPLNEEHGAPYPKPGHLFVEKHPFIQMAMERVRQRIGPELENGATMKMLARKGR